MTIKTKITLIALLTLLSSSMVDAKDVTEKFTCKVNALNIAELQRVSKDDSYTNEQRETFKKELKAELEARKQHNCGWN